MNLFQVAMILNPTKDERENGKQPTLVMEPCWIIASTDQHAGIMAGRKLADEFIDKMDRIQVHVRPF